MTGLERCLKSLNWELPDRIPVIPQNSDMAIYLSGYDMTECSRDPKKLASALLESHERFGYDGIMLGPDAAILAEALGCETQYRTDDPPAVKGHIIESLKQVDELEMIDINKTGRMKVWLEATKILLDKAGRDTLIICRADQGAFSLATLLRGVQPMMMDLVMEQNVQRLEKLLTFCNRVHIEFARAIKSTGAHMTTSGDSYGGPELLSPEMFSQYVLPYEKVAANEIINEIGLPYSIHICGQTDLIHAQWVEANPTAFEIDHKTDIRQLRDFTKDRIALIGNLDTERLCNGTPEEIEQSCSELIESMRPESGFIMSSGCSMGGNTNPDNLMAMMEAANKYGRYS